MDFINPQYLINSLIYSILGVVVLTLAFLVLDKITPSVYLWKEICEKQNLAVAVVLASAFLGIAIIIAASIHG